ncbi:hypothetical protein DB42_AQ00220 [Neochlamydia sp. EPS4]|nr:hypothetical protein DB42_AQ00220 [Neochlamydia sp. EPS4]
MINASLTQLKEQIYYFSLHNLARKVKCRKYHIKTLLRRIGKSFPNLSYFFKAFESFSLIPYG